MFMKIWNIFEEIINKNISLDSRYQNNKENSDIHILTLCFINIINITNEIFQVC